MFGKWFWALTEHQAKNPPIMFVLYLPLYILLITAIIIWTFVWHIPSQLLGFWTCADCSKKYHYWGWKYPKLSPKPDFFGRKELCHDCHEKELDSLREAFQKI